MEGPAEGEGKPTTTSVFPEFEIVIEEERGGTDEEKAARKKYACQMYTIFLFVITIYCSSLVVDWSEGPCGPWAEAN